MNFIPRLFPAKLRLSDAAAQRLADWKKLPEHCGQAMLDSSRFVVVDVETSGLNLARDRLIAIGAIAVKGGRIALGDSFEIVLQQQNISGKDNILIHGITGTAQTEGVEPGEALLRFLEFLGKDPLVAFHVTFDRTMIQRALKEYLGLDFKHHWSDLAYIAPALYPELKNRHRALDDWIGHFGVQNFARHSALADALATAQLFQVLAQQAQEKEISRFKGLQQLEKAQRWVSWTN
jgi:DNA polymerase-3 subunit epsilon